MAHVSVKARSDDFWTWSRLRAINAWLFPCVVELANDRGPIGELLRRIPQEILRDSARSSDPWADLCSNRFVPLGFHGLFAACASVLPAVRQLAPAGYGAGMGGQLFKQAKRARASAQRDAVLRHLFPVCWRIDAQLRAKAAKAGPQALDEFNKREAHLSRTMEKKNGKAAVATHPGKIMGERLHSKHSLAYLMATGWIRCGPMGDPGLCFYSDPALAELFSLFDWQRFKIVADDLNSEQIEHMRGRLGLRKAHEKLPLVTSARINPETHLIELNTLEAKIAKCEWPKSPHTLRCRVELCGHVLYRGVTS